MPNHIHGIIVINNSVGATLAVALGKKGALCKQVTQDNNNIENNEQKDKSEEK